MTPGLHANDVWILEHQVLPQVYGLKQAALQRILAVLTVPPPRCASCAHLRPFELLDEVCTCPVVNIRIHRTSARTFGCNLWEAA